MRTAINTLVIICFGLVFSSFVMAMTPQEKAAAIKEWRANCSDPDPDLRLAYLEAAIETKNQTIARVCIKQGLTSDNADTRNLALRAALASSERLTIQFSMPAAYYAELEKAGSDTTKQQRIKNAHGSNLQAINPINGLLSLIPKEVNLHSQVSSWYVLGKNTSADDQHTAQFSVVGDTFSGNGGALISFVAKFNLNLRLNEEGELFGAGKLYNSGELPVNIKLY